MNKLNLKTHLPAIILVAVFLVDVFNTQLIYYHSAFRPWSFYAKSLLLVSFFVLTFRREIKTYLWIIVLAISFLIGQFSLVQFEIDALKNFGMFIKHIYIFILFFGFKKLASEDSLTSMFLALKFIFLFVFASIILGFIFDIPEFRTYGANRFGYGGVLTKSSDTSYFLIMAFLFFEIFKSKFRYSYLYLLLCVVCTLISGTKASLLFLAFFVIYKLFSKDFKLNKAQIIGVLISVLAVVIIAFAFMKKTLQNTYNIFYNLYEKEGVISALTSFRSRKFKEYIEVYSQEWSWLNYIFGGKTGYYLNIEFDFVDLFIFFGIVGAILYLWLYYKIIFKMYLPKYSLLILGLITVAALSGQFFYNTNITLFFAPMSVLLLKWQNDNAKVLD
ncbi:MAG: hypothetical protein ABR595_03285 [Psychroflexus sp.]